MLEDHIRSFLERPLDIALFINHLFKLSEEEYRKMADMVMSSYVEIPETYKVVKEYPNTQKINLPKPKELKVDLGRVIMLRRSIRNYNEHALSIEDLSTLLYYSYGVSMVTHAYAFPEFPLRTVPTTGALSGVEIYLVANRVRGLKKGLYHWDGVSHSLNLLFLGTLEGKLLEIFLTEEHEFAARAPLVLFLTVVLSKGVWKYFARYYRHVLIDVGCIVQNLYLIATGLGLGVCAIAGIDEEKAEKLIKTKPDELVVLAISCGISSDKNNQDY